MKKGKVKMEKGILGVGGKMRSENEEEEEWDADFLEQLIQVEELALSSSNFSPPRQLSQRTSCSTQYHSKDLEINRLQTELRRVSNQLQQLEDECLQLKKKDKHHIPPQHSSAGCKEIGIQADLVTHHLDLSNKLEALWAFPTAKNLMSDLFVECSLDLFGSMNVPETAYSSDEAAKVSQLYSLLTQIGNGLVQLEALVEPLLDLCRVENVVIVHRSLRILRVFLNHLFTLERKAQCTLLRDNVIIEGHLSRNNVEDSHGASSAKDRLFCRKEDEASCAGCITFGIRAPEADSLCKKAFGNPGREAWVSYINWVTTFELMNQIAMRNTEEYVRSEAVSIMNMIVMSTHSYMDREKFGQTLVFVNISQLLRKEAGLHVQKEALHLLYLLLNCPKIFAACCTDCEEGGTAAGANENYENPSANKAFIMILEGLADCIACSGNSIQDLELRRNAVVVLAFLASSGKCGFEVLVNHKPCKDANFLMLILQVLVSEIDTEAAGRNVNADIFRARTLLIREALILLNRLVSNPAYAAIVLQILTSSRDMASLTIDVASRLSRNDQRKGKSDSITRQMRELEVVDLGRVFRRRVFTFLGDSI